MKYLGIDWGEKRIGLSYGDELGVAVPLPAVIENEKTKTSYLEIIDRVIHARNIDAIVVGYPFNMNGSRGFIAKAVDTFIVKLKKRFKLPVYQHDERLSSRQAAQSSQMMGLKDKRLSGKIDSRAAALMLQSFLDADFSSRDHGLLS